MSNTAILRSEFRQGGERLHLFQGTVEQNVIYHVMMDALRLKP